MNFFKKKLKQHKKGHANHDDDDLDDYIPPVPPHPSEIAKLEEQAKDLLTCDRLPVTSDSTNNTDSGQGSTSTAIHDTPSGLPSRVKVNKDKEEWKFFEQLTAKVEEAVVRTQSNLDELKKASAAEEIAKKSELDDEDDIPVDDEFFEETEKVTGVVAKGTANWIALEESDSTHVDKDKKGKDQEQINSDFGTQKNLDNKLKNSESNENNTVQSATPAVAAPAPAVGNTFDLLDDFGFGEEPKPSESTQPSDVIFDYENDYLDDPFDTSFVDISKIGLGSTATNDIDSTSDLLSKLLKKETNTSTSSTRPSELDSLDRYDSITSQRNFIISSSSLLPSPLDPLDTTTKAAPLTTAPVDSVDNNNNKINSNNNNNNNNLTSAKVLGESSFTEDPSSRSGYKSPAIDHTIDNDFFISNNKLGRSSRYGSNTSIASIMSNPFLVDNDFYTPTMGSGTTTPFSGAATPRRRGSTNPFEMSPEDEYPTNLEASAIAALTEDFVNAISEPAPSESNNKANDQANQPANLISSLRDNVFDRDECDADISLTDPVKSLDRGLSAEPFDPFATIHDEFVDSPKRASVTSAGLECDGLIDTQGKDGGDGEGIDNLLHAPGMPLEYLSDVSDNDEPSQSEEESGRGRKSSAFQMDILYKDKDEPPPKFDPLPMVISRNLSLPREPRIPTTDSSETSPDGKGDVDLMPGATFFDPFTTVIDKDSPSSPKIIGISADLVESITKAGASRAAGLAGESGNEPDDEDEDDSPESRGTVENRYSEGIINHGFTDKSSLESPVGAGNELTERTDHASLLDDQIVSSIKEDPITEPPATITASETGALAEPVSGTGPATQDNTLDVFGGSDSGLAVSSGFDNDPTDSGRDPFETSEFLVEPVQDSLPYTDSAAFDAFQAKFDSAGSAVGTNQTEQNPDSMSSSFDPFSSPANKGNTNSNNTNLSNLDDIDGFDIFDPFASGSIKPPKNTPAKQSVGKLSAAQAASKDSFDDDEADDSFRIVIKSKAKSSESNKGLSTAGPLPFLPPPPKTPIKSIAYQDKEPVQGERPAKKADDFDEFEMFFGNYISKDSEAKSKEAEATGDWAAPALGEAGVKARTESMESPSTPLFDDDTSQPLEEFPPRYEGDGWEMYLRHPAKKKLTGNRYWKKVFVRLSENSVIQLFNKPGDNEPFQELPLQPCYSLSEVTAQQYDQYGKIFTVKVQYIFYRERVGVRKGQIAKVMQGQITSVSGLAKLGMPLEHAPQVSQLIKLGSLIYDDIKVFANLIEDAFFRMIIHRDRALTYKTEEIQVTVVDEYYVETTKTGLVTKQLARVRVFLLAFINGMPTIEIGVNDMTRQGKEVVGRHDIIPVVTEEWIRLEAIEFHSSVMKEEFEKEDRLIKVHPPDACFYELFRFRVRPPKHRELPLQVTANLTVTKAKVELRCEVLVPGCISRKYGQIPCEDIAIRIHIPECWIYFFRTEKHLRYGSVKSAARRPGKIKGIERFLGATSNIVTETTMLEASAGVAKYEHSFHSLVWRIPRLPKEGQGAYTQQLMVCRLPMSSFDQIPDKFYEYVHIEFTMPSTTVSHAVIRSVSVTNENPPEKYVRYVSKHEYKTELTVSFKEGDDASDYQIAASVPLTSQPVVPESDKETKDDSDDSD